MSTARSRDLRPADPAAGTSIRNTLETQIRTSSANLRRPAAALVADTFSQALHVADVATERFGELVASAPGEPAERATRLVGDTVDASLEVVEVALSRTGGLLGAALDEAARLSERARHGLVVDGR